MVTITGSAVTENYDGTEHKASGYAPGSTSPLFNEDNLVFTGVAEAVRTDAGTTPMGLTAEDFEYNDPNIRANFSVTDGSVTVNPITAAVTIKGNTDTSDYDGEVHTVTGYTATADSDLYDVDSFIVYSGEAKAIRTDAGTTFMNLDVDKFSNISENFSNVTFTLEEDGYQTITPITATVTIVGNKATFNYDGTGHEATGYTATADTPLYRVKDDEETGAEKDFSFSGAATASRTVAGETKMNLAATQFSNINGNFKDVKFEIEDGQVEITPITAMVTITGHTGTFTYDGTEHTVSGYDATFSTELYNQDCFEAVTAVSVSRTEAGVTAMNLGPDSFNNISPNFTDVTFEVTDGSITINPAITVSKYLNNTSATEAETFTFNVKLTDDAQVPIAGHVLMKETTSDGEGNETSKPVTTNEEGKATFTISVKGLDTQAVTLDIPYGATLWIEEDKTYDPNNYITTINGESVSEYQLDYVTDSSTTLGFVNAVGTICRIGDVEFQTIHDAVQWAQDNNEHEVTIEMKVDYTMPATDEVVIPSGYTVTLSTASDYEGEGAATITRTPGFTGAMLTNRGTLNIADSQPGTRIIIDGNGDLVTAESAIIVNAGTLNVCTGGKIQNANSGNVSVSGGTITGNRANAVEGKENTGLGGAIYSVSGGVGLTGGVLGGENAADANQAKNGAAIFVSTGNASFSGGQVTGNVASEGGAVGVGSGDSRLMFSGSAYVQGNKNSTGGNCNVYLDKDTDLIINAIGLNPDAEIGIYVPGDGELYNNRGVSGARFGGYTSNANLNAFKNDRTPGMTVSEDNYKMKWGRAVKVELRELNPFSGTSLPPVAQGSLKKTGEYFPTANENYVSDIAAELLNTMGGISSGYTFACAFGKGATAYSECLSKINWNGNTGDWGFVNREGQFVTYENDPPTLVIYYSAPAYVTVANNTGYPLSLTSMTVNGIDVGSTHYGFVVARKGATVDHFVPIESDDLTLVVGESIKYMFPGVRKQTFDLSGSFTGEIGADIGYTYTEVKGSAYTSGETKSGTISTADAAGVFAIPTLHLYDNDKTVEIAFGESTKICKIVELNADGTVKAEHLYPSLQEAVVDGDAHYDEYKVTENGVTTVKVEMIQDYLMPSTDAPDIPSGRNFTFTTATSGVTQGSAVYTGEGDRAVISQDQGNTNSFFKATTGGNGTALTIENVNFEGKQLDATKTNGGVISTHDCSVTIRNVNFNNFSAGNGGAVYAQFGTADKSTYANTNNWVNISNTNFNNCVSKAGVDKFGGGIWTNAKDLTMTDCNFTYCNATQQGGAVYHRIDGDYSYTPTSTTQVSNCKFEHCYAGAAGGLEINAVTVNIDGCTFDDCQAITRNGGGFNAYLRAASTPNTSLNISNTSFNNCFANQDGGVFRTMMNTYVTGCTFTDNTANGLGGGIAQNNGNVLSLNGCTVTGNKSGKQGGGIYTNGNLTLENNCVITGNSLTTSVVTDGAGVYLTDSKTLTLGVANAAAGFLDTCTISGPWRATWRRIRTWPSASR